jgi:HEAT repeat protein
LGLQVLDTNSVAVLLEQIFATPMRIAENDPSCAAASSLAYIGSTAAQAQIIARIEKALQSPDPVERRNGCLTVWFCPRTNFAGSLPELTRDTNVTVRVAAVIAMVFSKWDTNFLPALVARLDDNEAAVRRFAAEALGHQTTNATLALPALLAAHAAETSRPNVRSDLGLGYLNDPAYSTQGVRAVMESSIRSIDPNVRFGRSMQGAR